jgi:hypothetical protein
MISTENMAAPHAMPSNDSFIRVDLVEDFENPIANFRSQEEIPVDASPSESTSLNYPKLQAVLCMGLSAAVSVGLIIWAIKLFR